MTDVYIIINISISSTNIDNHLNTSMMKMILRFIVVVFIPLAFELIRSIRSFVLVDSQN